MPKKVNGFLAYDGTFFERQPECKRYEAMRSLQTLCESHSINYENFLSVINSWHKQIREYLDEDAKCQSKQANGSDIAFDESDLPYDQDDNTDVTIGSKDTPGFLELAARRR